VSVLFSPKVIADQVRDELLATDGWLARTSILSADPGDIDTTINSALQQLSIGIVITPVSFRSSKPNLPGPYFDKCKFSAFIVEQNTLNRQGIEDVDYITAQSLGVLISGALHQWAPPGVNERTIVSDLLPVPFPKPDAEEQPSLNMWYVEMTVGGGLGYDKGRIAPVTFAYNPNAVLGDGGGGGLGDGSGNSQGTGTVTLSCATPGAAIFYVIGANKGYPSPANDNAALALGPIAISSGQPLFARAWLSGRNPIPAPNDQQSFTAP
jgi:hypothetical protein